MKMLFVTILVLFLALSPSYAKVKRTPIEDMPSKADFVVVGEVIDANCHWDDKGLMIYTEYTIGVQDNILGKTDSIIFMNFAGGTVDGQSIGVTDTPHLEVGKTYLLFGLADAKSFAPIVGHEQGVFRVLSDTIRGKQYIVDYYGNLLEMQDSGRIFRGKPVDLSVDDRLVTMERKRVQKVSAPEPVVRDAQGNVIPQQKVTSVEEKAVRSGRPLEKGAFIDYIIEQAKK
jgi:hypothetical protein